MGERGAGDLFFHNNNNGASVNIVLYITGITF